MRTVRVAEKMNLSTPTAITTIATTTAITITTTIIIKNIKDKKEPKQIL